ncbi:MAG: oxidoreductase [Sphingomonas sp. 28-66-16]|nr:MAG: oxidoreductase [Sphingomonas sp. 28-66-16]
MPFSLIPSAAPVALLAAATLGHLLPGRFPASAKRLCEALAMVAMLAAIASLALLVVYGPVTSPLIGAGGIGLALRIDAVSAPLLLLIAFIGWVVIRYASVYLDGEAREGRFMGWLCATLGFVMLMVSAGNLGQLVLAWIGTSLTLHRLLLFYPERAAAQRAARKKFVVARAGDAALLGATLLLWIGHGTGDIATLTAAIVRDGASRFDTGAAALLAVAAMLKSAQFPLHGWLTEVMEAPTPVSALLHAGVVNAGGFVLIRFADLMLTAPAVLAALVMIGGLSAVIGGLVMLTQPAVKTSLAWSTIAQMGFMLMQCGLGLFALALLHLLAHSLYKAHAFLASGGAVEQIAAAARPGPVAVPSLRAVARSFLAALGIYVAIGLAFGFHDTSPQAVALGAILIFGIAYLFAQGLADAAPRALARRIVGYAVAASIGYFVLHLIAIALTAGTLPPTPSPDALGWVLIALAVLSFGAVAFAQSTFPLWSGHPAVAGLRVHLANGLYANALFDRLLGSWRLQGEK